MSEKKQNSYLEIGNIYPEHAPAYLREKISRILTAEGPDLEVVLLSLVKSGPSDQVEYL